MRPRQQVVVIALLLMFAIGIGVPSGLAQTAKGPRLAVQVDGLMLFRGESESYGRVAFSPFLAFELGILSRFSLRVGFSPPLGGESGQQAFATHLAFNAWLGRGPDFIETGVGSYYQNTWCNGRPDYRAYTLYLGWRHVSRSVVFRIGGIAGLTHEGEPVVGIGLGFGRSLASRIS
ncbi:MAG: hypothetical protein ABFD52_05725 [Acidobacteriota bacterium]